MTNDPFKTSWDVLPTSVASWQGGTAIDLGGGWSVVENKSKPLTAPPSPYKPPLQPAYGGGGAIAGDYVAAPALAAPQDGWFLLWLAIYPWMLLVGALAYVGVSAPGAFFAHGLHLHPVFGIAAFFGAIWLYRQLMTALPTALALALPATLLSGAIAWALSDGPSLGHFVESGAWRSAGPAQLAAAMNGWMIAAMLISLLTHGAYWWHRRAAAKTGGWLLSRAPLATARELLGLILAAAVIGWAISAIW